MGKDKQITIIDFRARQGFTLIETLVSIAIFTVLAIGLAALVSNVLVSSKKQSGLLADQDQARRLVFAAAGQLRDAQVSSTGGYPLENAGAQDLRFFSEIDGDNLVERVHYYVQNNKLYRGIIKPSGSPLSYNSSNEQVSVVQNNLANGSGPVFFYYDGSYSGSTSTDNYLPQPVSVTDVRYVRMEFKVYNQAGLTGTNYFTVSAGAALRNLKDNLGEGTQGINIKWHLATSSIPSYGGSVAVSPAGPEYDDGALVYLNAYPNIGYGFSSWSGNVNNPSGQNTTMVLSGDSIVSATFSSIPQTLTGSVSSRSGGASSRKWTLRISNNTSHMVSNTNLYDFDLDQTAGSACSPDITSPAAFPASVGNISAYSYKTYQVTINFSGCSGSTRFTANFTFAGNNGNNWGSASIANQQQ